MDETGDVKKGNSTVGVQRQYSGTAGRIENCQIAVYLDGHAHLLARRNRRTSEIAYHLTWALTPVPLQTLVTAAGMRWRIEETFQGTKELAALDEHQVHTWTSWHRWVTLALLAYAFLAITRTREADHTKPDMIALTCNEIRHLLVCAIAPALGWEHRLQWSTWRRRHQAIAKRLHYQRQLALAA